MREKFNNIGFLILSLLALTSACDEGFTTIESGVKYKIYSKKGAVHANDGEYLMIDLSAKTTNDDSLLFSTSALNTLLPLRYDSYKMKIGVDNPLEEIFYQMGLGDSALVQLMAKELINTSFASALPHSLIFEEEVEIAAKVISILPYQEYKKWQERQLANRKNVLQEEASEQLEKDRLAIKEILEEQNIPYKITKSGIGYYLENKGTGQKPVAGDSVHFNYSIQYTDGTQLAGDLGQSGDDGKSFVIGNSNVLPCWQESICLLSVGGKGRFFFPSGCAFGGSGAYGVRPNEVLVIDLELESIH